MRSLLAFIKKEWTGQLRLGHLLFLGILFILFGIMNPAIAKLTPWLFEILADSLAESGMIVTGVTVDALTSWVQFFKNIPMALIVFLLMESNIFTKEYQSGTLVLALTKGLHRSKVVIAKTTVLILLWSAYYWLCFGITYGYNAYFWDNDIAQNLFFAVTCWWLFGLWTILLIVFFSAIAKANTGVLIGTGAVVLAAYLTELLPKVEKYTPAKLMNSTGLLYGANSTDQYTVAMIVTVLLCVICFVSSILIWNKKKL